MRQRFTWLMLVAGSVAIAPLLVAPPALAFTPVSELKDVPPDHWAYNAIKTLVEKYQIMEGFPDNTFKGTRYVSRFELAAALAKVMARVDEMVSAATGEAPQPSHLAPSVSPEDLRTIARLQQEFKDELTILKGRVDTQDQRLTTLEKRLRLGGSLEGFYRIHTVNPLVATRNVQELDNLRLATTLKLDANMAPDVAYRGQLTLFNSGVQSLANGHLSTEGGVPGSPYDVATPLYVRRSYLSWTPAWGGVQVGMMTFSDSLKVGSTLLNEFRAAPIWPAAESGYGFVGTPPLQPPGVARSGAAQLVLTPVNPLATLPEPAGRIHWNPGVNVAEDLLDPNSVWSVNTGSAPSAVVDATWGPVEVGGGVHYGSPGASSQLALSDLPRTFPLVADYYHGYALGKVGLDLGWLHWGVYGHADNAVLGQVTNTAAIQGKGWGSALDIGSDALGFSLGHAETTRRDYDPNAYYDETSGFLVSNSLFGTGVGLGIGVKVGNSPATGTASRKLSFMPYGWASTGAYVKLPGISILQSETIAAQTTGSDLLTSDFGSGLTAIVEMQIHPALPALMIEYDMGRFYGTSGTPSPSGNAGNDNQLIGGAASTHEQILVGTSLSF
jgi:hypothetical protein